MCVRTFNVRGASRAFNVPVHIAFPSNARGRTWLFQQCRSQQCAHALSAHASGSQGARARNTRSAGKSAFGGTCTTRTSGARSILFIAHF
eukprot:6201227-Pleurochrysis_carterae.AAC.4